LPGIAEAVTPSNILVNAEYSGYATYPSAGHIDTTRVAITNPACARHGTRRTTISVLDIDSVRTINLASTRRGTRGTTIGVPDITRVRTISPASTRHDARRTTILFGTIRFHP
jgi:hypothetical protein